MQTVSFRKTVQQLNFDGPLEKAQSTLINNNYLYYLVT